jgi:hypothetical protein
LGLHHVGSFDDLPRNKGCPASVLGDVRSDDRIFLLPAAGDDDFRALVGKSQRSSVADREAPPVRKTIWFSNLLFIKNFVLLLVFGGWLVAAPPISPSQTEIRKIVLFSLSNRKSD